MWCDGNGMITLVISCSESPERSSGARAYLKAQRLKLGCSFIRHDHHHILLSIPTPELVCILYVTWTISKNRAKRKCNIVELVVSWVVVPYCSSEKCRCWKSNKWFFFWDISNQNDMLGGMMMNPVHYCLSTGFSIAFLVNIKFVLLLLSYSQRVLLSLY